MRKLALQQLCILLLIVVVVQAEGIVRPDIIGGTPSPSVPSYYATSIPPHSLCGAVLIHRKFLLTAAHCQDAFYKYAMLDGMLHRIVHTHVHPLYDTRPFHHDLCILELEEPVGDSIEPLRYTDTSTATIQPNASVWTMGYGLTNASDPTSISDTLQQVQLHVLPNDECRAMYTPLSLDHRIAESVFCTYDDGQRDACHGDSGSPILSTSSSSHDNTPLLVGIVSWGRDCAGAYPAVHATLDVDFIDSIVPPCDDGTSVNGYYDLHWQNDEACIDLNTNRMFRAWKSMNFTCGSCDPA